MTDTISTYSAMITWKKYFYELGTLLSITGLTYLVDIIFPDIQVTYPEYAAIVLIVAPMVRAIINYLNHKNDEVPVTPTP